MRSILLAVALALPGCTPAGQAESDGTESAEGEATPAYIVRGAERPNWSPGWAAVIRQGHILLDSPTSAGWYAMAAPVPRNEGERQILAAEGLTLSIEDGRCAIAGYRAALPDRIELEWDGGRFEGCGGPRRPTAGMDSTVWELVRIGGEPAPDGRSPAATLHFARNRGLGGTLACNDGGIRTTWTEDGGFVHGAHGFEQTAIGCNQPEAEAFGMRFWGGLVEARRWRREGERLFITLGDGREAELRYLL